MIVLAFDTATPATAVALSRADGGLLEARDDPARDERPGHATRLLPLAERLLASAGIGWHEVERFAVGTGPGTFTGLRVGIATARGLAQSRGVPLVGVSSLQALARGAGGTCPVLAAIDARRGEMFVAGYQGEVRLFPPVAVAPAALPAMLAGVPASGWLAVGDGAVLYRAACKAAGAEVPVDGDPAHRIRATALCELAAGPPARLPPAAAGARQGVDEAPVLPEYLRRPDAKPALQGIAV